MSGNQKYLSYNPDYHISSWYSIACVSYQDFLDRMFLLTRKQHNQWFVEVHVEIISSKVLLSSL